MLLSLGADLNQQPLYTTNVRATRSIGSEKNAIFPNLDTMVAAVGHTVYLCCFVRGRVLRYRIEVAHIRENVS